MSVSTSSGGGTLNNCCDPCGKCSQNQKTKQHSASKQTKSGGCTFSQPAVIRWNCTWTNKNLMSFTRCPDDRPAPEFNCTPIVALEGTATKTGTCACPDKCNAARSAAIIAANRSKPPAKKQTGTANWTEVPNSQCPLSCRPPNHLGSCYRLNGNPTPPDLPDEPIPNISWSC